MPGIESPLIDEIVKKAKCDTIRDSILQILAIRLDRVPQDIAVALQPIEDEARLLDLVGWAAVCPDLDAFRSRLPRP